MLPSEQAERRNRNPAANPDEDSLWPNDLDVSPARSPIHVCSEQGKHLYWLTDGAVTVKIAVTQHPQLGFCTVFRLASKRIGCSYDVASFLHGAEPYPAYAEGGSVTLNSEAALRTYLREKLADPEVAAAIRFFAGLPDGKAPGVSEFPF